MKKIEVTSYSKEEAAKQAPFKVKGDATTAYCKWLDAYPDHNSNDLKEFTLDYLIKKNSQKEGEGFVITLTAAIKNTRNHPYVLCNIVNKKETRKYTTIFQLIDDKNQIRHEASSRTEIKKAIRDLYDNGFTGDLKCIPVKLVQEGEPVLFTTKYSPSKNTREGKYILFGIEKED